MTLGLWCKKKKIIKNDVKNTVMPPSRNHDLVTQDNPQTL